LKDEFHAFEPDEEFKASDARAFSNALVNPVPDFVRLLLEGKDPKNNDKDAAVRDLYAFLLHKRYYERLNLLYFAFDLFCESSPLPESVINETPYPHEDGTPPYRARLDSSFRLL
jgi:hypothetical protein